MAFTTRVITSEIDVPAGYVRISEIGDDRAAQKLLSDAQNAGKLAAVKLMRTAKDFSGPVWVERRAAVALLAGHRSAAAAVAVSQPLTDAMATALVRSALGELLDALARVERAVDRLADRLPAESFADAGHQAEG